ncbi:plus-3 domain-containing protein [Striga asiatica]|uniref:Plus-3 domain-containing protein n=1 Tax=Striga asiatica TaxID=4170 RepID=A0A5A7QSE9_STRAF|nr:plus-3 domain-containing protein [Striga asiatica]
MQLVIFHKVEFTNDLQLNNIHTSQIPDNPPSIHASSQVASHGFQNQTETTSARPGPRKPAPKLNGPVRYSRPTTTTDKFPTFDDVRRITIARPELARWHARGPGMLDRLIPGCFVRVAIGPTDPPVHRLCVVLNTDETKPDRRYAFGGGPTAKYLNLVWGDERSAARWRLFECLVRESARFIGHVPSRDEVLEKIELLENVRVSSSVGPGERRGGSGEVAGVGPPVLARRRELNKLHDFELRVSLVGLEKFGGPNGVRAGYLANKGRVEGRQRFRAPEDDVAMSVEEYRRRRGLT